MHRIEESITIAAPLERVFALIADIESYPSFLPTIKQAKILRRGKGWCEARFVIDLLQRLEYTVRMTLKPPRGLRCKLIEGEMMSHNDGEWKLTALSRGKTKATYRMEVKLTTWIPQSVVKALIATGLVDMLDHFRDHAEAKP